MKQDVQAGKYYEDGGAFRVIYQPDCTHPWVHFSAEAVGNGVDFFERALGAPNPLPASNQVWQWKTAFNFLGLVGVVMFLLSFVAVALDIPYFSMLRAAQQPQPAQVKGLAASCGSGGRLWRVPRSRWQATCGPFRMSIPKPPLFTRPAPYYGRVVRAERRVHRAGAGGLLLFYGKKNGFSPVESGLAISLKKLWRTAVLAVLACGLAFLILFFADYFFKTDFRLWVITMKAFEADKVLIGLRYLPMFLFFYVANSVAVNCFNYNTIGGRRGWGNTALLGLFNALGAIVFLALQYGGVPGSGMLRWYATEGWRISRHLAVSGHCLSVYHAFHDALHLQKDAQSLPVWHH